MTEQELALDPICMSREGRVDDKILFQRRPTVSAQSCEPSGAVCGYMHQAINGKTEICGMRPVCKGQSVSIVFGYDCAGHQSSCPPGSENATAEAWQTQRI